MNMSAVLERKGGGVEMIDARCNLEHAARRLTMAKIGSLVVLDAESALLGVLSERQIVRALALGGRSAGRIACGRVVEDSPATCGLEDGHLDVLGLMTLTHARHIPVIQGRTIVGIVSVADLLQGQVHELADEVDALRNRFRMRR